MELRRGLSSRAVLISVAVAAIAVAAALFWLLGPGTAPVQTESEATTSPSKHDPRASLEATGESGTARAGAPEAEAAKAESKAGTRTLVVSGRLIDATSRAGLPDVEVRANAGPLPGDQDARAKTKSDAEGRYSLELAVPADLPWDPKIWGVWVSASGDRFQPVHERVREEEFERDSFVAKHDLEVAILLAWRGRIVRESDGSPIAGGTATLLVLEKAPTVPRSIAQAQTDDSGAFLIQMKSVEPGALAFLGSADGFLAKMAPTALDPARSVDVGDIALGEGACIEGFVTTANGSPPMATEIQVQPRKLDEAWMYLSNGTWAIRNGALVPRIARAPIGPDGKFRVCGLAADVYFLAVSYAGCTTGSHLEWLDVRAPASGLRIELARAVYRLKVFDAKSGKELARSRFLFDGPQEFGCNIEGNYVIATDPGIESPGQIVAEGYRALKCSLPALGACEVRDLEFRLEPLPQQVAVTIVVTSPAGTPVENVEVEIRSEQPEVDGQAPMPKMSHSAPDGRHELPPLVPGTYHVQIDPRREDDPAAELWLGVTLELHVVGGSNPIEVRLEEGGLVQATVTRKDGTPVEARTSLVRTPQSEPEPIDWRNESGSFIGWIPKQSIVRLAKPLPGGPWTLRFEANGCTSQDVVVNVLAGGTTAISVELDPRPPR